MVNKTIVLNENCSFLKNLFSSNSDGMLLRSQVDDFFQLKIAAQEIATGYRIKKRLLLNRFLKLKARFLTIKEKEALEFLAEESTDNEFVDVQIEECTEDIGALG